MVSLNEVLFLTHYYSLLQIGDELVIVFETEENNQHGKR